MHVKQWGLLFTKEFLFGSILYQPTLNLAWPVCSSSHQNLTKFWWWCAGGYVVWWWPLRLYCHLLGRGVPFHSHFPSQFPVADKYELLIILTFQILDILFPFLNIFSLHLLFFLFFFLFSNSCFCHLLCLGKSSSLNQNPRVNLKNEKKCYNIILHCFTSLLYPK